MDWEVTREPGEIAPSPAAGPCIGEELATMDAKAAFGPVDASRRTLGRKISHRKNPSETFAFAAGQLFQQTPEDFYNLLDAPLETSSKLQGFHHVVSEVRPVVSPYTSSGFALQQAASAEPESAASQHTLGEVKPLAVSTGTTNSIPPPPAAANATQPAGPSIEPGSAAAAAAAAAAGADSEDEQMSDDSELEEQHQPSDHAPRKGRSRKQQQNAAQTRANAFDPTTLDPRRAKRILANRQSAQRSRMKRLQYIHDLENRSAATSATLKEIQREVERCQEQQIGVAEAVDQREAQVETLTSQLLREQSFKATLISHITALRHQVAWQQQQQQAQQQSAQPLGAPPQQQGGQPKVQQQQQQQQPHQSQPQRHLQLPVKHESYAEYPQQQQQQLEQHASMPAHQASFYQQRQQQQVDSRQQQQHTMEQQQTQQGLPYQQQFGGQPPVQQMHAMGLGHSGAAVAHGFGRDGCLDHPQLPQQQQLQTALQHPSQRVSVNGLHQHQQQQQQLGGSQLSDSIEAHRAAAAAASAQQHQPAPSHADRTLQQTNTTDSAAGPIPVATNFPSNSMSTQSSPSPDKGFVVDGNTHSPIDLGLASSLGPGMSDGVAEADLEDLLQDHSYLVSGFAPSASGGLTGFLSGGLPGSGGLGLGSGLESGPLRLTPSLELPSDMAEGLGHNGFGISGGLGSGALGSSGYAVKQTTEGLAGGAGVSGSAAGGSDCDLRQTLSM